MIRLKELFESTCWIQVSVNVNEVRLLSDLKALPLLAAQDHMEESVMGLEQKKFNNLAESAAWQFVPAQTDIERSTKIIRVKKERQGKRSGP